MDSTPEPSEDRIHLLLERARQAALRWCRCASDADDVAQEAVLRLLAQDVPPTNVCGWLSVVTRRMAGRQREREQRRAKAESAFALCAEPQHDPDLFLDVGLVLTSIGKRDRAVLLRIVEGAHSRDIAAEFGCGVRDVGQMVARARQKARRTAGRCPVINTAVRKRKRRGT